ncbi:MAG: tRNA dihydrouridine synthase DusB [Gammaproteobacteria bacterium 28-57-27]|nr:MAG: tRNA dihydrouridine synthase DusB [Gammaproteobacteria bacterium 28-57-27]
MRIGSFQLDSPLALAPMAGVTDRPFRHLCKTFGAGLVVGEMSSSNPQLRDTRTSHRRLPHEDEPEPRTIQIVGNDPANMAEAARHGVAHGAQIVDINMGCPAKKICQKAAGSALLGDSELVGRILDAVVAAVEVPVTLKIRTGLDPKQRNAVQIARIAQAAGIQALAIHGRTRADMFRGEAEYDSIRAVREAVDIPLWANGDIDTPAKAREVMAYTGAHGIMLGRATLGRPWLFAAMRAALTEQPHPAEPSWEAKRQLMLQHVNALHQLYGEHVGVRVARKHITWYCAHLPDGDKLRTPFVLVDEARTQFDLIEHYFAFLATSLADIGADA